MIQIKRIFITAAILICAIAGLVIPSVTFALQDRQITQAVQTTTQRPVRFQTKPSIYETLSVLEIRPGQTEYDYVSLPLDYVGLNLNRTQNTIRDFLDLLHENGFLWRDGADWNFDQITAKMYVVQDKSTEEIDLTQLYNSVFTIVWYCELSTKDGDQISLGLDDASGKVISLGAYRRSFYHQEDGVSPEEVEGSKIQLAADWLSDYFGFLCTDIVMYDKPNSGTIYMQDLDGNKIICPVSGSDSSFDFYAHCA